MSRTYRKTKKGRKTDWLPNLRKEDVAEEWPVYSWLCLSYFRKWKRNEKAIQWLKNNPHRAADIDDWFYWMTTPSSWNNARHTRPRRAKERQLLHRIKTGKVDCEDVAWPNGKKPHIYYW